MLNELPTEFCWSQNLSPEFVAELCRRGFPPMADLTQQGGRAAVRAVAEAARGAVRPRVRRPPRVAQAAARRAAASSPSTARGTPSSAAAASSTATAAGLHAPLVATFKALHTPQHADGGGGPAAKTAAAAAAGVRMHSFELWQDGCLVAGEIGYSMGACYTSLSGFFSKVSCGGDAPVRRDGARVEGLGYAFWDLGMVLPYKLRLGARTVARLKFLRSLAAARDCQPSSPLATAARRSVDELLGAPPPPPPPVRPLVAALATKARRPPAAAGPRGARRVSRVHLASLADATGGAEAAGATRRPRPPSATAGYLRGLRGTHASAAVRASAPRREERPSALPRRGPLVFPHARPHAATRPDASPKQVSHAD